MPTTIIDSDFKMKNISRSTLYWVDKENKTGIEDLAQKRDSPIFQKVEKDSPAFSFSDDKFWFVFNLKNRTSEKQNLIIEVKYQLLDSVTLFQKGPDDRYIAFQSGDHTPYKSKIVKSRNPAFQITLPRDSEQEFFLAVKTEGTVHVPLYLWKTEAFYENNQKESIFFGIIFGILFAMLCYNLFLFSILKDLSYLYYVLYITGMLLFQISINGFAYTMIFTESPLFAGESIVITVLITSLGVILFSRQFLNLQKMFPVWNRLILVQVVVHILAFLLVIFTSYNFNIRFVNILLGITTATALSAGVVTMLKGYKPARLFMLAWGVVLIAGIVFVLKDRGILPKTFLTQNGVSIGAAIESILLSVALSFRIKLIEKARLDAELKLISEKKRISTDIHDNVGSDLTSLIFSLKQDAETSPKVGRIVDKLDIILYKIRDIIYLKDLDTNFNQNLEEHMETLIRKIERSGKHKIKFVYDTIGHQLSVENAVHLHRVFQEWMTNILRHSNGKSIDIFWQKKRGRPGWLL